MIIMTNMINRQQLTHTLLAAAAATFIKKLLFLFFCVAVVKRYRSSYRRLTYP